MPEKTYHCEIDNMFILDVPGSQNRPEKKRGIKQDVKIKKREKKKKKAARKYANQKAKSQKNRPTS